MPPPYDEDDLLPISGLQHLLFCPRQFALIHVEQVWQENLLTAQGRLMHERVHEQTHETRGDVRIARGLPLRSLRLGITGQADVVEFHTSPNTEHETDPAQMPPDAQTTNPKAQSPKPNAARPFPIEYKRGKPKAHRADDVQLCAQALCLEEMLDTHVPAGALYYGRTHRRQDVTFDPELRRLTEDACHRIHQIISTGEVPPPKFVAQKCRPCSLIDICQPRAKRTARPYLDNLYQALDPEPDLDF